MNKIDTLIIGAGVSGLTYAANTKENYLIIEKEERPGGLCKTFYQDGFIWDYAGHFFHFAKPDTKRMFESNIDHSNFVICNKKTNINYNGTDVDYPFQMNIHQLPKDEFIDCLYDLFHRREKNQYDSFEDMLYGKFGKSITEKFLKPYNEKLYACDLNELDTNAMGRFFPYANPQQIIDNMKLKDVKTYNSTFDYPKKGAQFFVDLLLSMIDTSKIRCSSEIEKIDFDKKIAVIDGVEYQYEKLINTMPLNHFLEFLPEDLSTMKNQLNCNKVLVFNLGFDNPAINKELHWTYIPMKDIIFYRCGFYNNILGDDRLSMYIEIGYKENEKIDIDDALARTLDGLKKLEIIKNHNLVSYNSLVINPGYVHITEKSVSAVKNIRDRLQKNSIYTIGRYGKWTYCSIEDCMIDAINLAKGIYNS